MYMIVSHPMHVLNFGNTASSFKRQRTLHWKLALSLIDLRTENLKYKTNTFSVLTVVAHVSGIRNAPCAQCTMYC